MQTQVVDASEPAVEPCRTSKIDQLKTISTRRCFVLHRQGGERDQSIIISPEIEHAPAERMSVEYLREHEMKFVRSSVRAPGEPQRVPYGLHWAFTQGDEIVLHWTNGFVGGSMCLRESSGGLVGVLMEYNDYGPPPPPQAVFLKAVQCAADTAAHEADAQHGHLR